MQKKILRHARVQDVVFIYLSAKVLFAWSYSTVSDTTKAIVKNEYLHFALSGELNLRIQSTEKQRATVDQWHNIFLC